MGHDIGIRRATLCDSERLRDILLEAALWIRETHGFRQWREEMFTEQIVNAFIRENEVFVARYGEETVGCFSVHWAYEELWGERYHDDAGYVHRLAVSRNHKGTGIGKEMLNWAERYIQTRGKGWLRLDCMADNASLNQYYVSQGFQLQGRYDAEGWSAHLYERRIQLRQPIYHG